MFVFPKLESEEPERQENEPLTTNKTRSVCQRKMKLSLLHCGFIYIFHKQDRYDPGVQETKQHCV